MRKRLTQYFPFLTPLRTFQAKTWFSLKTRLNPHYRVKQSTDRLAYCIYSTQQTMINTETGFDIRYQYNKADNLRLLSLQFNTVTIKPQQILSFNYLAKNADKKTPYKDGLVLINEEIVIGYGGGLCQLSNMIYYAALHTPLTIVKRHGHTSQHLYDPNVKLHGIDATVSYGFADLQLKNNTNAIYQLIIEFPSQTDIRISIYSDVLYEHDIEISNENLYEFTKNNKTYQHVDVIRFDKTTNTKEKLYTNICELAYKQNKKGN